MNLTVLTATLNAEKHITRLINCLRTQTDREFEWLVVDGGSSDKTLSLVSEAAKDLRVRCLQECDFGIYDALNKGVRAIVDGYYLVLGADDQIAPNAIENYRKAILESGADIVTAAIRQRSKTIFPRERMGWLYGLGGVAGSHAVGMVINKSLHLRFGFYSNKFPIAADQYFIKNALIGGATIVRKSFLAGEFSDEGTTGADPIGVITDVFRVQLRTERYVTLQYIIFIARILKIYVLTMVKSFINYLVINKQKK